MSNKVLVVAPHPDDETLGCGGTLLKHKKNGNTIYWMIVTNVDTDKNPISYMAFSVYDAAR